MNVAIRRFRKEVIEIINRTSLPMEVKRLTMAEILHQLEKETEDAIRMELNQMLRLAEEKNSAETTQRENETQRETLKKNQDKAEIEQITDGTTCCKRKNAQMQGSSGEDSVISLGSEDGGEVDDSAEDKD